MAELSSQDRAATEPTVPTMTIGSRFHRESSRESFSSESTGTGSPNFPRRISNALSSTRTRTPKRSREEDADNVVTERKKPVREALSSYSKHNTGATPKRVVMVPSQELSSLSVSSPKPAPSSVTSKQSSKPPPTINRNHQLFKNRSATESTNSGEDNIGTGDSNKGKISRSSRENTTHLNSASSAVAGVTSSSVDHLVHRTARGRSPVQDSSRESSATSQEKSCFGTVVEILQVPVPHEDPCCSTSTKPSSNPSPRATTCRPHRLANNTDPSSISNTPTRTSVEKLDHDEMLFAGRFQRGAHRAHEMEDTKLPAKEEMSDIVSGDDDDDLGGSRCPRCRQEWDVSDLSSAAAPIMGSRCDHEYCRECIQECHMMESATTKRTVINVCCPHIGCGKRSFRIDNLIPNQVLCCALQAKRSQSVESSLGNVAPREFTTSCTSVNTQEPKISPGNLKGQPPYSKSFQRRENRIGGGGDDDIDNKLTSPEVASVPTNATGLSLSTSLLIQTPVATPSPATRNRSASTQSRIGQAHVANLEEMRSFQRYGNRISGGSDDDIDKKWASTEVARLPTSPEVASLPTHATGFSLSTSLLQHELEQSPWINTRRLELQERDMEVRKEELVVRKKIGFAQAEKLLAEAEVIKNDLVHAADIAKAKKDKSEAEAKTAQLHLRVQRAKAIKELIEDSGFSKEEAIAIVDGDYM